MTRVLLITNKDDVTIDFVVKQLQSLDIDYYRFNTEELFRTLHVSLNFVKEEYTLYDDFLEKVVDLKSFTSVYYRRPGIPEYTDNDLSEGERQFLRTEAYYTLEGIYKLLADAFWLNPLWSIREAENKIYQLSLAKEIGFNTPDTLITSLPAQFNRFNSDHKLGCIIKPVHNGRVLDATKPQVVYTSKLEGTFTDDEIKHSINYIQAEIKKKYDVRVTVVGEEFFAVAIDSQDTEDTITDWRKGEHILNHITITLPKEIMVKCQKLLSRLNLRYGAIDFIQDYNDNYVFLEINPNGQYAWIEHLTGLKISKSIALLLNQ